MRVALDGIGCFPTGRHYPGIAHLLRVVAAGLSGEHDAGVTLDALPLVAIDTETTGKDPSLDRIVEIACVVWRDGGVASRTQWLVNPGRPIPAEARAVHGISDDDVRGQPQFPEIAAEVLRALEGCVPVAYNAAFDRAFLQAEIARAALPADALPPAARRGVEWIDSLVWARELQRYEKGKSLGEVATRLGIEIRNAHRAVDDAEAAVKVLVALWKDPRVPRTYGAFVQEQRRVARVHEEEREKWRSRQGARVE